MDHPQVIAITGSSKGIGRGIALHFLERGYKIAGCSRSPSTIDVQGYTHTELDVCDEKQVRNWINSTKRHCGRIDMLICNAGIAPAAMLLTTTPGEVLESVLRTNVGGTFYACREVGKLMMLQRFGRIITLSSMAVGLHQEGTSAYAASKSAVVEFTKIFAKELAPFGITCNVIAPSMIMTDAVAALGEKVIKRALESLTIKRELTIEEICHVIAFLFAPESNCITGQVIQLGLVS